MRTAIFGGGFGLYGYLPALLEDLHAEVCLPERYRERLEKRPELAAFVTQVAWVADGGAVEDGCDSVVVALPPAEQVAVVQRCLTQHEIRFFQLEKPLAATPEESIALLAQLEASGRHVRIGYTLRQTEWAKAMLAAGRGVHEIDWTFRAHHYVHDLKNWKRDHRQGGGALRFYGIHVLALLAEAGYTDVPEAHVEWLTEGDMPRWTAKFTGQGLVDCRVTVDSDAAETIFMLKDAAGMVTRLNEPFATNAPKTAQDGRVKLLAEALKELLGGEQLCYKWYAQTNRLWQQIERITA